MFSDKKKESTKKEKEEQRKRVERLAARRPLKMVPLEPPEYSVDPEILTEGYYEKEVRFAGIIKNVPFVLDSTNRTEVLRIIDRGMKEGVIPHNTTMDNDCIFSLSVNNIKISQRDGQEELLVRIPIYEVANICYIQDDNQSLLALKYGNPVEEREMCKMAVMYADRPETAHEVCSLIGQCFQIVYTEATMQFFDKTMHNGRSFVPGGQTGSLSGTNTLTAVHTRTLAELIDRPQFITDSNADLTRSSVSSQSTMSRGPSLRGTRHRSESGSEIDNASEAAAAAADLLRDYMEKLPRKLNADELKQFAILLSLWQGQGMPFEEFCAKVVQLYGPARKSLLAGMQHFIPEKDYPHFEQVLESLGVSLNSPDLEFSLRRSRSWRTDSDTSMFSTMVPSLNDSDGGEFDRRVSSITSELDHMHKGNGVSGEPIITLNPRKNLQ